MADEALNFSGGTRTQREGAAIDMLEPWRETDSGRVGMGSGGNVVEMLATGVLAPVTVSTTGTTTLALSAGCGCHSGLIVAGAGADPGYIRAIVLPDVALGADGVTEDVEWRAGDRVELRVEVAASLYPQLEFFAGEGGPTLLILLGNAIQANDYVITFRHDGTAWQFWGGYRMPVGAIA